MIATGFGIKGILPASMLDWEGYIVSTIFMGSCNMRCPFCHNSQLALGEEGLADMDIEQIKAMLAAKEGWVDGVCITGGEPTINNRLPELMRIIKSMGLKVKLDTNGTCPQVLRELLKEELLDAVAMDIKTTFAKYPQATRVADFSDKARESIALLIEAENSGQIELEFRTTVVPPFVEREDVVEIARFLGKAGAKRYFIQQFNPKEVMDPSLKLVKPYVPDLLFDMAGQASEYIPTKVRT